MRPLLGIKNAVDNGDINIIEHKGLPIHTQWNIVWLKNKSLSPVANAFISYLEAEKEAIKSKYFAWVLDWYGNFCRITNISLS